jgi:hypothetical protein
VSFSNPIIGGNDTLVRQAMQSEGFVAGVSGWRITREGDAEFNTGTFRGTVRVTGPAGTVLIDPTIPAVVVMDTDDNVRAQLSPNGSEFLNSDGTSMFGTEVSLWNGGTQTWTGDANFHDFDSDWQPLTFIAPPSGIVKCDLTGQALNYSTTTSTISYGVKVKDSNGNTVINYDLGKAWVHQNETGSTAQTTVTGLRSTCSWPFGENGELTPGVEYTFQPGWRLSSLNINPDTSIKFNHAATGHRFFITAVI